MYKEVTNMEKQRILIWAGIALAILVGCITYYNL
nr:MAG TPA: outer membrane protein assembly factor [Caudoviricetes sp.]DAO98702.1 MAG TPA: outer membrane protein assembly factor [Caudoviricetes sp.]DAP60222.1 MAG TPA: outer membrane protein assembly factor [Caudoviricetes sp.]DAR01087.1 MAG TPA: outer membrane protein assembly factor [Caudoviricetes sp.]DAT78645.1 MAG TPA: outer membrane protein assembly factor [Caudoviricetes sp.]